MSQPDTQQQENKFSLKKFKTCVLIPTYNNAQTILSVVHEVLNYADDVIVVNDGSTDNTATLLQEINTITLVSYSKNMGKGHALKLGIRKAHELGYEYVISIDSDGQHFPVDIKVFLEYLDDSNNKVLLIGSRNLQQENVPQKSSFGNKFSSFWYWVNTGIKLKDTQSGYRLYPVLPLAKWRYFTTKYEFEIEIIVRAAWAGIEVKNIPVGVYYPPANERISHFRPFKDFTRISILNTFLVTIALVYIHPRNFLKLLFSRDGLKVIIQRVFIDEIETNKKKSFSLAFGVFMGIVPIWGFQLLVGIPLAIAMKLNKGLFILAANISIFPITAFWIVSSWALGKWLLGEKDWIETFKNFNAYNVVSDGVAFFLGGTILALFCAVVTYIISMLYLSKYRKGR